MAKLSYQSIEPVVVDDGDPGFELLQTATGKPEWWHKETNVGYGGDMVWTGNTQTRKDNYARWKPTLPSRGLYKVEAYVPSNHATTTSARYTIVAGGQTGTKTAGQASLSNQWADLGTFTFTAANNGTEYVELADPTGETANAKRVGFDAIRFTPTTDAPPPPTGSGWSFPVGGEDGSGWRVTLPLGASWSGNGRNYWGHLAEDWSKFGGANLGQPVYAAADGEVVVAKQNCGSYLDVIVLKHSVPGIAEPVYSMYGHIESTLRVGDRVTRRQKIGVLGDTRPTFGPHLHFEIKNHTALVNGPFSSCTDAARKVYVSAGYSGKRNDYAGGDFWDLTDGVAGNRYYNPSRFIRVRFAGGAAALARAPEPQVAFREGDGEPRCTGGR
jgi:murein DD-endopeptidase MepM/ murein hydrolase activator NlpD